MGSSNAFSARLATFKAYRHPQDMAARPNIIKLATAGFYYDSSSQHIKCSQCQIVRMHTDATQYKCTQCNLLHNEPAVNAATEGFCGSTSAKTSSVPVVRDNLMQRKTNSNSGCCMAHRTDKEDASSAHVTNVNHVLKETQNMKLDIEYQKENSALQVTVEDFLATEWVQEVLKIGFSERDVSAVLASCLNDPEQTPPTGPASLVHDLHGYMDKLEGFSTPSDAKRDATSGVQTQQKAKKKRRLAKNSHRRPRETKQHKNHPDEKISPSLQALQDELEDLEDEYMCKLCVDLQADTVFLPCGHFCCCAVCAAQMFNCPVCRVTVTSTVRVQSHDVSEM